GIYILDRSLQPTAVGITGELYITGAGVARGYLNRPELTAETFIKDDIKARSPYPTEGRSKTGNRLYKTGDLGRWQPDGNIEFIGRMDQQVKIRGFRIELGEIENILQTHNNIKQATVVAKKDKENTDYLAAYYIQKDYARDETADTPQDTSATAFSAQLRHFLSEKLPAYMIPAYFIQLGKIPLTSIGKIDKKALPEPGETAGISTEYQAPTNETEKKLAALWQEVLGQK
ncbi:MAG: amino acid adenylation domain-containing protein, partial [bacterium]|nr:amino acid adenylation domain-containing protein [bacterium]